MSKRLTTQHKRTIVRAVVAASFDKRIADLKEQQNELARRVRDSLIKPEDRIRMDALPRNFFGMSDYGAISIRVANTEGVVIGSLDAADDLRIPSFLRLNAHIVKDAGLLEEIVKHFEALAATKQEARDFEQKTTGVIATFNTSAKLLDAWPTLRELLGDAFFDVEPVNPVVTTVNELDAVLVAGKPFEPVAEAA